MKRFRENIPNAITMLNLASGSVSVIFALSGDAWLAAWMILAAAVLDFLDGFLARLLHAKSEIGTQLDSLADVVSFGLAPSAILYKLIGEAPELMEIQPEGFSLLPFLALCIVLASAYRLARFNNEPAQQERFSGLPTPATGLFIASIPLALWQYDGKEFVASILENPYVLILTALVLSWLMVSRIPMMSLKIKNLTWRDNRWRFTLAGISVVLLIFFGFAGIALGIILYLAVSLLDKDRPPEINN